jgi:hypothetical protein
MAVEAWTLRVRVSYQTLRSPSHFKPETTFKVSHGRSGMLALVAG